MQQQELIAQIMERTCAVSVSLVITFQVRQESQSRSVFQMIACAKTVLWMKHKYVLTMEVHCVCLAMMATTNPVIPVF